MAEIEEIVVEASRNRGAFSTRDHKIISIGIVSSAGAGREISDVIIEFNLYQDIYSAVITGDVTVVDNNDLITSLGMCGNEYLYVNLDQPNTNSPINKYFRIYKIKDRTQKKNSAQTYTLYFVSEQQIISESVRFSKAYTNKTISDIVSDVSKNYLKIDEDELDIESTVGIYDYIIPYFRPIEAIQWAASRSFEVNKFCYFFFETKDSFKFKSLQSLYKQKSMKTIQLGSKNAYLLPETNLNENQDTIDRFLIDKDYDLLSDISSGAYSASLLGVDVYNREAIFYKKKIIDFEKNLLNGNVAINVMPEKDGQNLFNKEKSLYLNYLEVKNRTSEKDNDINMLITRAQFMAIINRFNMKVILPGDITLSAGDIVDIYFPNFEPFSENSKTFNEYRSGKYLITAMSHKIVGDSFSTILELCSDSVSKKLNSAIDVPKIIKDKK